MSAMQAMPVELVGGPMDGTETTVPVNDPKFDVYLFRRMDEAGRREVMAYAFRGRSLNGGKRWALEFLYYVARQHPKEGGAA